MLSPPPTSAANIGMKPKQGGSTSAVARDAFYFKDPAIKQRAMTHHLQAKQSPSRIVRNNLDGVRRWFPQRADDIEGINPATAVARKLGTFPAKAVGPGAKPSVRQSFPPSASEVDGGDC